MKSLKSAKQLFLDYFGKPLLYFLNILINKFLNYFILTDKVGEDSHTIEEVVQTLLDRWMEVNNVMDERHKRVNSILEINRIHNETDAMSRILETHKKWLLSAEESINNSEDLPKLIDQSKVCDYLSKLSLSYSSQISNLISVASEVNAIAERKSTENK